MKTAFIQIAYQNTEYSDDNLAVCGDVVNKNIITNLCGPSPHYVYW